ncbi:SpaA isopeptide-forming pilin-related protein, partial [Helcococcus bovis]|uniref:SpaA isopeptide-forming pilin-related protein n=1 Tax=Helcococcus bovis TaxID=3153252 RepID=UPI0038B9DC39
GATIKVVGTELGSKEERQIYEWLSTGETNTFKLKPGTYKLIEEAAPKGYKIATEISFEVTVEGEIENVNIGEGNRYENGILVMVDDYLRTNVKFSKQDIAGKELEGATI